MAEPRRRSYRADVDARSVPRRSATVCRARRCSPSRTLGARLKCELFQRTGSFKARGALNKLSSLTDEEKARGVIAITAGNHAQAVAFAAADVRRRRARRDVAGRLRAEDRGDARLRRRPSTSRRPAPATPSRGSTTLIERDRPHARPSVRRPARARRRRHGRARDRGGRPRRRRGRRPRRRRRADRRHPTRARATAMRVIAVEPETSPALHDGDRRRRARARRRRRSIADGLNAPFAGRARRSRSAATSSASSSPRTRSRMRFRFLYERAKLACEPAGAAADRRAARGQDRGRATRCSSSSGATSPRKPPLLSWPGDEGRDPSRVRLRDRPLLAAGTRS